MEREILLVGSVPLRPAAAVFATVANALGPLAKRLPDGEQHGWILASLRALSHNPLLERDGEVEISSGGAIAPTFRVRDGHEPSELRLGPFGYAEAAATSYEAFRRLRDEGVIAEGTRFQVTMPGPGTSSFMVRAPADDVLRAAREALAAEIEQVLELIPVQDVAIQIDLAMEAEHEEYRRRPDAFETPVHETFDWTLEQMADSAAWLADRVPEAAELGFHICSIWHHYQPGGQDNRVLVDTANALGQRIERRIDYIHIPTIPEHDVEDFAPLADLALTSETTVFLGVIHRSDGLQGARRRIAAAQTALPEFGIASFCGLGILAEGSDMKVGDSLHEDLRSGDAALAEILALHRDTATVDV